MPASGPELPSGRFGPIVHGGRAADHGALDSRRIGLALIAGVSALALFAVGTVGALILISQRSIDHIDIGNVGDHDAGQAAAQARLDGAAGASGTDGGALEVNEVSGSMNVLVVGTDSRESLTEQQLLALGTEDDGSSLTDTIMLVQVDAAHDVVAVLSFPRDLYVPRCDGTRGKINAAFAIGEWMRDGGGPECLVDTIEEYTDIEVDHYVQVDLAGFIKAVDAIGGVEFYVDEPLLDREAGLDIDTGCVHFDGTRALGFVRARTIDNDFGRIARQQRFLMEMVDKVSSAGTLLNPMRLFPLVAEVSSALTTDSGLGLSTQRDLAFSLRGVTADDVEMRTIPGDIRTIDGASVVVADEQRAEQLFEAFRRGTVISGDRGAQVPDGSGATAADVSPSGEGAADPIDPVDVEPLVVLNGVGAPGLAGSARELLESHGFTVMSTGNADRFGLPRTRLLFAPGARDDADLAAAALAEVGIDVRLRRGDRDTELTLVLGEDLDLEAAAEVSAHDGAEEAHLDGGAGTDAPTAMPSALPPTDVPDYRGAQISQRRC